MKADGPEGFLREMTVEPKVKIDRKFRRCPDVNKGYIPILFYLVAVPLTIGIAACLAPREYTTKRFEAPGLYRWSETLKTSNHIDKINQFLALEMIATSTFGERVSFEEPIEVSVQLNVRKNGQPWEKAFRTSHIRELICREQKKQCDSIYLLDQVALQYDEYNVEVNIGKNMQFVKSIEYKFSYVTSDFTVTEIFLKYGFLVITLWRVIDFCVRSQRAQRRLFCCNGNALLEQRLAGFLLIGLLFFNDPLFICKILSGAWYFDLASDVMRSGYAVFVLIYIMIMSGHLQREQRDDKQPCCYVCASIIPLLVVLVLTFLLIVITRGTIAVDPASDFPSDYGILYKGLTWLLCAGLIFVAAMLLFRLASASFSGLLFFGPTRRQLKDMDELNYFDVTWPDHRRRRFTFFANMTLLLFAFLALLRIWSNLDFNVSPRILDGKKAAIVFGYIVAINLYVLFNAWAYTPVRSEPNGPKDSEFLGQTSWMESGTDKNGKPYSFRV